MSSMVKFSSRWQTQFVVARQCSIQLFPISIRYPGRLWKLSSKQCKGGLLSHSITSRESEGSLLCLRSKKWSECLHVITKDQSVLDAQKSSACHMRQVAESAKSAPSHESELGTQKSVGVHKLKSTHPQHRGGLLTSCYLSRWTLFIEELEEAVAAGKVWGRKPGESSETNGQEPTEVVRELYTKWGATAIRIARPKRKKKGYKYVNI
ncbi:MAG: hypothetical protein BYD32DRAFT_454781 [Podila humilis]|nr:MAG: hypothetical protein BYD32DRAFT_454781 [Podila humilis]